MKYKVFKIKYEVDNYEKDPIQFFIANLTYGDCFDTIDEARENIEKYGEDYVQYYIMPYVYMT